MKDRLTIRELARIAGYSTMTVSMALRNHPRVALKTRKKIQLVAKKLGYMRDPVVSALMNRLRKGHRGTADKLGVLTWWKTRDGEEKSPLGSQLYEGIRSRANQLGYNVECFWAKEPGMTGKRLSTILHTRSIRGLILSSVPYARGHASLDWSHFAAASAGSGILKPDLPRATFSNYQAMFLALRNLRRKGYHRVGYLNLNKYEDMAQDAWRSSYLGYYHRTERRIVIPPLLLYNWSRVKIAGWLKKYKPEAIVGHGPELYWLLQEMGYHIPQDIGFATLDYVAEDFPDAAGIHQPREWLGAKLVDLVVEQLENHEFGIPKIPKTVMISGFWKDGSTLFNRRK